MLPVKYEIIMVPSNIHFSNIAIAMLDFPLLLLVKLSLLILLLSFFGISPLLLFNGSLFKFIALPTIALAIVVALSRS